ncbi:hypothetical protein CFC21_023298 [Triticum aestivum]|uniref:Uncharacterized protein n=2 Tax=Triticum aestivum TaxID=4565 RepID=A0A9R1EE78_WHEAT|nr:hypothetical protein CFC21_023298 [Triticum aestivum]
MISTRKDRSIAAFIQELNQHIRCQENRMCAGMIDLKKAMTKITELEEELKSTCDGYEEEITTLVEKNDHLKKLRVFMGFPATGGEDDCTCPENYIIIDDTDSDPDDSDDDYVDEAGADIMESSLEQFF